MDRARERSRSPSAASNGRRLRGNEGISARIGELKATIAQGVIAAEIRKRSWRVAQLQALVDDMLALRAARKVLYAGQLGEMQIRQVGSAEEEKLAISEGFRAQVVDDRITAGTPAAALEVYPKTLYHPGYPNGSATGLLVKDYRGKNAEQEIWKFDAALVAQLNHTLKQAAIEEGQWTEKREVSSGVSMAELERRLNAGRDRVAAEKRAADAKAAALHIVKP